KIELERKTDLSAILAANEFLIGRITETELEDRAKTLMEKSPEILQEVGAVIGDHARLQEFKQFIKTYQVENKDKSIKDAALAWTEQTNKPAEPAKLGVEPPKTPAVPKAPDAHAELQAASLVGTPQEPQKQTVELSQGPTDADKAIQKQMHAQMFPEVAQ
ncbi:hypothetical protein LCGC14_3017810, partial [marine sediment metagenome]